MFSTSAANTNLYVTARALGTTSNSIDVSVAVKGTPYGANPGGDYRLDYTLSGSVTVEATADISHSGVGVNDYSRTVSVSTSSSIANPRVYEVYWVWISKPLADVWLIFYGCGFNFIKNNDKYNSTKQGNYNKDLICLLNIRQ